MIVNAKEILEEALKNKYAVPQFNINNLEWTKFILEECEKEKSPVILGVSEGAVKYMVGEKQVVDMVTNLVNHLNITVPVVIHLDHGSSFESCARAIDAGFTSVMIDASKHSYEENLKITKQVVDYARKNNVSVEAELGKIGGEEDGVAAEIVFADPLECSDFIKKTQIDFLAPAIGSVHGLYKGDPNLQFNIIEQIVKTNNIPLVLHGGSGIPDKDIITAVNSGITKINVNTDLQVVWAKDVRNYLDENKFVYDPRKVIKSGEKALKRMVEEKISLFKSANRG